METLDEITRSVSNKTSFFNHVFNFNDDSKDEMMNIVQYAVLAIIPVIILNKATQRIIPEADEEKGTPEIAIEVVLQTVSMFLGILIIHRLITFIPTHSGVKYSPLSVTSNILAVLVIILSLQTKLGEKVSILVDRAVDLWEGKTGDDKAKLKKRNANVKVSQPISQNNQISQSLGYSGSGGSTPISQLPIAPQITKPQDYSNSYHQSNTYGAQQPQQQASYMNNQMMESNEPMAANFGGSSFGSSF
jgi:hypothetical protein